MSDKELLHYIGVLYYYTKNMKLVCHCIQAIMALYLTTISNVNKLLKYADDSTLI